MAVTSLLSFAVLNDRTQIDHLKLKKGRKILFVKGTKSENWKLIGFKFERKKRNKIASERMIVFLKFNCISHDIQLINKFSSFPFLKRSGKLLHFANQKAFFRFRNSIQNPFLVISFAYNFIQKRREAKSFVWRCFQLYSLTNSVLFMLEYHAMRFSFYLPSIQLAST